MKEKISSQEVLYFSSKEALTLFELWKQGNYKIKKTLNLLFLLLAVFAVSSCSSDDDEKKDSVKEITIYVSSETGESYGLTLPQRNVCL